MTEEIPGPQQGAEQPEGDADTPSQVAAMAKKLGSAAAVGVKKATPVVAEATKKGAKLAAVGAKKGIELAGAGAGKARDLVLAFWQKATESDPPLDEDG